MFQKYLLCITLTCLLLSSCSNNGNSPKRRGAIVFGDSSMIVTERDPQFLTNNVLDFVPTKPTPIDTVKDTIAIQKDTLPDAPKNSEQGLSAPFKSLALFINGVEGRLGKSVDWAKDWSASFTLTDGNLNNKTLRIDAPKITKVEMRYQTVLMLELPDANKIAIEDMPLATSDWKTQKGLNGNYAITGLSTKQLQYDTKISSRKLERAVQKIAKKNKLSRNEERKLLRSLRKVREANQAPISIGLSTVIWKIDGKDASGKDIHRELRIDLHP